MHYGQYAMWLRQEHSKAVLELEPHCVEAGPYLQCTIAPNKPPWQLLWVVKFADGNFLQITENWFRRRGRAIGPGGVGYREHFSFHYGPANPLCDADGVPLRSKAYPAIFRIDCDRFGPHLHFMGEDHVPQDRVKNFRISDAEPFEFFRSVLTHRATGKGFDSILQFQVTK
jgi:hypothetical protein